MKKIDIYSEEFSSGTKHYFLDFRKTRHGTAYLRISRSDAVKGKYVRSSVVIFDENLQKFIQALSSVFHHAAYL